MTISRVSGSDQMRVLVISDAVPERNGVGSYYADLVAGLKPQLDFIDHIHPEHAVAKALAWPSMPMPGDATQRLWCPNPKPFMRYISSSRPDVIIIPTPGPFGLAGMLWARQHAVPIVTGFHTHLEALADLYWRAPARRLFGQLCRRSLTFSNRLLFKHSSLVLANAPDTQRQAKELGATAVEIMGTSVSGEFLRLPVLPVRTLAEGDRPRLLFAGRLAAEKAIDRILNIAARRPDWHFTIAGDGPARSQVESAASRQDNLDYLGWVRRDALIDVLDSADLFVLPSVVESFGTVALEALARARPTLVSHACGIAEWASFKEGLHTFDTTICKGFETGIDRVFQMSTEERQYRATRGRQAAADLDAWNATSWLDRLARVANNSHPCVAGVVARASS